MRNSQPPSINSIYQNALPFYIDRADIFSVDEAGHVFAQGFLKELLAGEVNTQVDASNLSTDKLRHLYFESKNYEKTAGAKTFGFGYPLLIDSFEGELMVAPLFIWYLAIEPAQTKVDSWVLRFSEQHSIRPNYQVVDYLKRKYDLDWKERSLELAMKGKLTESSLNEYCKELIERLQLAEHPEEKEVTAAPGIDEIGLLSESGSLHWSGVLSLFPPQNVRWKAGERKPEDVFSSEMEEIPDEEFVFPFLPADPEQVTALETIFRNKMTVVEGIDALGKTQTVLNLLINALSNGQKCLVVSELAPALKKTQKLLASTGFDQLHFLLDDALNDKMPMLELLRVAAAGVGKGIPHNEQDFQVKRSKFLKAREKLDAGFQAVRKKIFGDYNWTETVGLLLRSNSIEGKELLASHLNRQDFEFSKKEHEFLKKGILICDPSFEQVNTLKHPLSNLHDQHFIDGSAEERLRIVEAKVQEYLGKTKKLQHRYISETDAYSAKLKRHYLDFYEKVERAIAGINDKVTVYSEMLGADFEQAGSGSFRLFSLFSSKKKKVAKAQNDIAKEYRKLLKMHAEHSYFDHEPLATKEGMNMQMVIADVTEFQQALKKWRGRVEPAVQDEVLRLNSKTAHVALDVKEQITELEYALEVLLEELNESQLYRKAFENKTLTVPQRQKYLESIIEHLETTQLNLRDFAVFHQWQNNWLKLGPLGQKVIRALVKVKPTNWLAAFESWYYHNLLSIEENANLPSSTSAVAQYSEAWHSLKPLIASQIAATWQQRQGEVLKKLKRADKRKYQLIFERSGHKKAANLELHDVLENGIDAVTDFLPILFVTPTVALNTLPKDSTFDMVVFEESNRFSVESATRIADLGKRIAIFGSDDNNGNETSLLQYALESGVPTASITNIYEAPSQQLAQIQPHTQSTFHFSNDFFVDNLEGRFHEQEGTNDVEAQHIIRLLNQVKQTPQRIYPTVGIVTFTIEQRDLISSYLLKLKQQSAIGSEKIRQLERNGMGVYHAEEIFGQQFDVLILSCTFGMVDLKGTLTKKMQSLNSPEGVSYMRTIINKPVQQVYFVHSFSDGHLKKLRAKPFDEGTWLLSNFIQLAEASINGNQTLIAECLEAIGKLKKRQVIESIFTDEISKALHPYLDKERFEVNTLRGDAILPILLHPLVEKQPKVAIHPDGFFADTKFTSGIWEKRHQASLQDDAIKYLPTWSLNWYKDAGKEARLLASQIIKMDSAYRVKGSAEGKVEIAENGDEQSDS